MSVLAEGRSRGKGRDFITRVILLVKDGPKYTEVSLKHPIIDDKQLKEFDLMNDI